MEAYFDNSATTKVLDCVKDAVVDAMCVNYGNAAAKHRKGVEAENLIREAKKAIADTLKVQEKEILFTSGGTESNNTALIGTALANRRAGKHLITTGVEHPSIYNTMSFLEEMGFEVTYLPVDHLGHISLEDLEKAIREDTILVSVMYVNNEVGAVEPIEAISQCIKKKNPKTLFHVDAIQAYGKYKIRPKKQGIDLLSVSGHKIHAPKGVGFLYIREGIKLPSYIHGGSQERGKRAGTENVAGIVGMGKAAELAHRNMRVRIQREIMLRNYLMERVLHEIPDARVNGHRNKRLPGNVSVSFRGVEGASLLILMEEDGICASGGSACNTGESRISYVIEALGVPDDYAPGTVRLTLGKDTTKEEIDCVMESLKKNVEILRG